MRIFVVEASGRGGMIHYDYHLCRALYRIEIDITLVTSTDYELRDLPHSFPVIELLNLWDPRDSKPKSQIVRLIRRGWRGLRYLKEWVRLVLYLKRQRPDIIIFGEIRFGFERYFLQFLRSSGLLLADIVHDIRVYDTSSRTDLIVQQNQHQIARYNRIYNLFDMLLVHNQANYNDFLELYDVVPERVHQIPLGTNELVLEVPSSHSPEELCDLLGVPSGVPIVLFFGTLSKYKGVDDLLHAFPSVHGEYAAHLIIAGYPAKDVDSGALRTLADELGIAQNITWYLEYIPNEQVEPLVSLADIVVMPYRAITQSAVLQIAYACGCPVIGTRVGGLPDVIEEGKSGLLADPSDPDSLAEAIKILLADPVAAKQMGEYAKGLANTVYSWDNIARQVAGAIDYTLRVKVESH